MPNLEITKLSPVYDSDSTDEETLNDSKTDQHESMQMQSCNFPFHKGYIFSPIADVPRDSQMNYIIKDIFTCLKGFNGKYIMGIYNKDRTFDIHRDIYNYETSENIIQKILALASKYSSLVRFTEERCSLKYGLVNQALCGILHDYIKDYLIHLCKLEYKYDYCQNLTYINLLNDIQPMLRTMTLLAEVIDTIFMAGAQGGRTLSILYENFKRQNYPEEDLLCFLRCAAVPYFDCLRTWLEKAVIYDPQNEFMIRENPNVDDSSKGRDENADKYWRGKYSLMEERIPSFLKPYALEILNTGKYLDVIRHCKKSGPHSQQNWKFDEISLKDIGGEPRFAQIIYKAYNWASEALVVTLFKDYDIMNRLASVKRYFTMEQGDFASSMLELCEKELSKVLDNLLPARINTLVECAVRSTCAHRADPYHADIFAVVIPTGLVDQVARLQIEMDGSFEKNGEISLTGWDTVSLNLKTFWPLSLFFNRNAIVFYQMMFKLLLHCRRTHWILTQIWLQDKMINTLPRDSRCQYLRSSALRQKMLLCVNTLCTFFCEVVERRWLQFIKEFQMCKSIDEMMEQHTIYMHGCHSDCLLMKREEITPLVALLECCLKFAHFMQGKNRNEIGLNAPTRKKESGKRRPLSFSDNVALLEKEFDDKMNCLLWRVGECSSKKTTVSHLTELLERMSFNNKRPDELHSNGYKN